jgi:hypothetical protein
VDKFQFFSVRNSAFAYLLIEEHPTIMLNDKKQIDKLLGFYFSGTLAEEVRDVIRGWLLSDDDKEEREAALKKLFEKFWKRNRLPDEYTRVSLAVLHDELSFSDRMIRSWEAGKNAFKRRFGYIVGSIC